jgi:hypothetical protein
MFSFVLCAAYLLHTCINLMQGMSNYSIFLSILVLGVYPMVRDIPDHHAYYTVK